MKTILALLLTLLPASLYAVDYQVSWDHTQQSSTDSYIIEEQTPTTWVVVGTVTRPNATTPPALTFRWPNVAPGTHNVRVRARNVSGDSSPSSVHQFVISSTLNAPTNVRGQIVATFVFEIPPTQPVATAPAP